MSPDEIKKAQKVAMDQIKAVFEDGHAEINERSYVFTVMTFEERRTVLAYLSTVRPMLAREDLSFLDSTEYKALERDILFKRITVDDMALGKRTKNIFDEFPEDYIMFVTTALQVISYPFLKGKSGV